MNHTFRTNVWVEVPKYLGSDYFRGMVDSVAGTSVTVFFPGAHSDCRLTLPFYEIRRAPQPKFTLKRKTTK